MRVLLLVVIGLILDLVFEGFSTSTSICTRPSTRVSTSTSLRTSPGTSTRLCTRPSTGNSTSPSTRIEGRGSDLNPRSYAQLIAVLLELLLHDMITDHYYDYDESFLSTHLYYFDAYYGTTLYSWYDYGLVLRLHCLLLCTTTTVLTLLPLQDYGPYDLD